MFSELTLRNESLRFNYRYLRTGFQTCRARLVCLPLSDITYPIQGPRLSTVRTHRCVRKNSFTQSMGSTNLHLLIPKRIEDLEAKLRCFLLGLGDKTITICIAIDTWSISIKNVFDKTFDIFYSSSEENRGCEASLVALTKALALW